MILLVDAGNTRIKWALSEGSAWLTEGVLGHDEVARLAQLGAGQHRPRRAICVSVAGDQLSGAITRALATIGLEPEWFRSSSACCGVTNGYEDPAQLGADRWAALVGAHALHESACLVVCAGTATTVDLLDADGHFQGGLILPGEHLMRQALAGNTAQLPFADGHFVAQPRNTMDAIVSGCRQAQVGAIERMYAIIAEHPGALCLLAGGASAALEPSLSVPVRRIENLVLHGLAVAAAAGPRLPALRTS
jgi:type III pantothenate kinase